MATLFVHLDIAIEEAIADGLSIKLEGLRSHLEGGDKLMQASTLG